MLSNQPQKSVTTNLAVNLAIVMFHAIFIIILWNSVFAIVRTEREDTTSAAITRIQNLTIAFEQYATRIIESADTSNRGLIHERKRTEGKVGIAQLLAEQSIDDKVLIGKAITNERGDAKLAGTSASSISDANVAGDEWFRVHVERDSGKLFVGKPVTGRLPGKTLIPLSRRISKADGSFDGVVAAFIEPSIFTDFLHEARLNPLDIISVTGLDGVTRARLKGTTVSSGNDISRGPLFAEIAKRPLGSYFGKGSLDGVPRYFSYRVISEYELVATVGISEAEVMAALDRRSTRYFLATGVASVVITGFALMLMIALASRKRAGEQSNRLAAIVESSEDAIIGTDLRQKITSWNPGAEKLFGYAAAEMMGQSITRLIQPEGLEREAKISTLNGRGESAAHSETVWWHKDGRSLHVSVTDSEIKAAGVIVGASMVAHDISERKQAQAATRESQARYRTLFEHAPAGILIADPAGYYIDANASMCRMLGYSHEELTLLHSGDIVQPSEVHHVGPALKMIKANTEYQREWQFRRQDGSAFAADVMATMMPDGNVMGMVRDITERKQADAALRESEEQLRLAVEATKLGTWDFDPVAGERHGSDQSKKIFGLPTDEALTREQIIACVHPDDRQRMDDAIAAALLPTGTGELHVEFRIVRADGEVRWVESHGRTLFENSAPTRLIGTVLDVTERKLAENSRQTLELGYRRLFEAAQDGILILNADNGQIVDVNPYLIEMLGYSREEFLGKELWEIGVFKDIAASKIAFDELQKQGYIRYDDLPLESRAGVVRQVEFVSNSYLVGERRVIQCNIRDITERRHTQDELNKASQEVARTLAELQTRTHELDSMTEQLWQASKLATMGELAASIAHELNNPLTTVTLSVEALMLQLSGDESKTATLKTLRDESDRMANLVGNLLQFSRRSHAQISTLNIAEELATALNLINYHLRSHDVKVVQDIAANLPTIHGDRQQLLQVFLNLITNASDAMPEGGTLTVRVRPESREQIRSAIAIEFADTGMGIEAAVLPTIWEPFVTTKPEGKGTGLGLPICRRTIEEHGGTIEVESQPGQGSTFRILLPAMEN